MFQLLLRLFNLEKKFLIKATDTGIESHYADYLVTYAEDAIQIAEGEYQCIAMALTIYNAES